MADVYEGGIPNQGFDGTFPTSGGEGPSFQPNAGPAEQKSSNGGPATFSGSSSNLGDYMGTEAYDGPGDIEPGPMKVVDLDDIKSSV